MGFVGIAAYSADWDHFTWWFQATFTVVGLLAIVGLDAYIFFFFQVHSPRVLRAAFLRIVLTSQQCLAIQVVSSVILMSVVDCGVFEDAYTALETEEYAGGDFALHYLPNIIALALVDPSTLVTDPESIKIQAWAALGTRAIPAH